MGDAGSEVAGGKVEFFLFLVGENFFVEVNEGVHSPIAMKEFGEPPVGGEINLV